MFKRWLVRAGKRPWKAKREKFHTCGGPRRRPCLGQGRGRRTLTFKLAESSCIRISHLKLAMHFAQSKTGTAGMDTLAKGAGWNFRMESGRQLLRGSASLVGVRSYYLWVGGHGKVLGKTSQFYSVSHILLNLSCQLSVSHQVGSHCWECQIWKCSFVDKLEKNLSLGWPEYGAAKGAPKSRVAMWSQERSFATPPTPSQASIQQPQLHCKHGHLSLECLKQRSKIGAVWCCIVVACNDRCGRTAWDEAFDGA